MARETKEAYWVLYDCLEKENGSSTCREYWQKALTEKSMWKFVASLSSKGGHLRHVVKGKLIKIN